MSVSEALTAFQSVTRSCEQVRNGFSWFTGRKGNAALAVVVLLNGVNSVECYPRMTVPDRLA